MSDKKEKDAFPVRQWFSFMMRVKICSL